MAHYLLMTLEHEADHAARSPAAMAVLIAARASHAEALRRAGVLADAGRLRPSKHGKRVAREGDRIVVHDGPFAEHGRSLAAYHWVEADDIEGAVRLALGCPSLPDDMIEVRPLMKGSVPSGKDDLPGKIFACAVLGRADDEAGWIEVMDRIDAETRERIPAATFLGGLRLDPPTHGRTLVGDGDARASLDGPFLESKEVIGGLFFLRMPTIDDAVAWASATRFVAHGTLEIRELWRT